MIDYSNIMEVLRALRARGLSNYFYLNADSIECTKLHLKLYPEDFEVKEVYRFEGGSRPDNNPVFYVIESKDGIKGVLIDAHGTYTESHNLEMATKLSTNRGKNLYQFWGTKINESLKALLKQEKSGVIVNLCSAEYFKAIKPDLLDATVITPVFKEFRNGAYRFITIYAKKARGLMGNFIIRNHLKKVETIATESTVKPSRIV